MIEENFGDTTQSMINDLEQIIQKSNFATALVISVYMEYLGRILTGNFTGKSGKKEYNSFLFAMNEDYKQQERELYNVQTCHYDVIRCGLVHHFFIKKDAHIDRKIKINNNKGMYWDGKKFYISLEDLLTEFKRGINVCDKDIKQTGRKQNQFIKYLTDKPTMWSGQVVVNRSTI